MERGNSYVFDLSDSSVGGHPLAFKNGSTSYTTGVTTTGNPGTAGAQKLELMWIPLRQPH